MITSELDRTTLLDIDKLQTELREAHRLLKVYGMEHYWTPNIDTFANVALSCLSKRVS